MEYKCVRGKSRCDGEMKRRKKHQEEVEQTEEERGLVKK